MLQQQFRKNIPASVICLQCFSPVAVDVPGPDHVPQSLFFDHIDLTENVEIFSSLTNKISGPDQKGCLETRNQICSEGSKVDHPVRVWKFDKRRGGRSFICQFIIFVIFYDDKIILFGEGKQLLFSFLAKLVRSRILILSIEQDRFSLPFVTMLAYIIHTPAVLIYRYTLATATCVAKNHIGKKVAKSTHQDDIAFPDKELRHDVKKDSITL